MDGSIARKRVGVSGDPEAKQYGVLFRALGELYPVDFQNVEAAGYDALDARILSEDLRTLCRRVLPPYEVPAQVLFVVDLPHNSSGKVMKHELRRRHLQIHPSQSHVVGC